MTKIVKKDLIGSITFGQRIAEQELDNLAEYFVETEQWRNLEQGIVDIIYGPKGSGKSALYSLLVARKEELTKKNITIIPAENPNGATAFSEIKVEPPTSEHEFVGLWKLYFLCLLAIEIKTQDITNDESKIVLAKLEQAKLIPRELSLKTLLLSVKEYSKRLMNAESVEGGLGLDPTTGLLNGVKGKITFREPSEELRDQGLVSVDSLLEKVNVALGYSQLTVWLLLDRLDVAFEQSEEIEHNALRALFRAYLDMAPLNNVAIKVFLRTDIWKSITDEGFREASHITRQLTITWQRQSLVNLVLRRLLANPGVVAYYGLDQKKVLSDIKMQEELLKRVFPNQVDAGEKKPATFDWILSRTQDGTGLTAPRELIHLLSSLQKVQTERLELGHPEPSDEWLFDRQAFKEALKLISNERLTNTLYAENNSLKGYIEMLEAEKTQQNPESLAKIWDTDKADAHKIAEKLVNIGFFEKRGTKHSPVYWVPFLYRDALKMVQGEAR
jgi:hypothetical protein